jgi:hypothetical protein
VRNRNAQERRFKVAADFAGIAVEPACRTDPGLISAVGDGSVAKAMDIDELLTRCEAVHIRNSQLRLSVGTTRSSGGLDAIIRSGEPEITTVRRSSLAGWRSSML